MVKLVNQPIKRSGLLGMISDLLRFVVFYSLLISTYGLAVFITMGISCNFPTILSKCILYTFIWIFVVHSFLAEVFSIGF